MMAGTNGGTMECIRIAMRMWSFRRDVISVEACWDDFRFEERSLGRIVRKVSSSG